MPEFNSLISLTEIYLFDKLIGILMHDFLPHNGQIITHRRSENNLRNPNKKNYEIFKLLASSKLAGFTRASGLFGSVLYKLEIETTFIKN